MLLPGFACDQSQPPLPPFAPLARIQPTSAVTAALALASPPASPPQMSPPNALGNLFNTCRSLQALLSAPPAASLPITPPQQHQELLPTTPLAHAPSPMKLRLRSRKVGAPGSSDNTSASSSSTTSSSGPALAASGAVGRKRIVKRAQPPRGLNKRRRAVEDDLGRNDDVDFEVDVQPDVEGVDGSEPAELEESSTTPSGPAPSLSLLAPSPLRRFPSLPSVSSPFTTRARAATVSALLPADAISAPLAPLPAFEPAAAASTSPSRPQTPKRARIAPEALPLGLDRGDFHALHADGIPDDSSSSRNPRTAAAAEADEDVDVEADGETWSTEEDRMLVELVLEKLKLSKSEWQDCARTLGKKDRHSLGRRWKSLMLHGEVGLKTTGTRSRRSKLHGTWR